MARSTSSSDGSAPELMAVPGRGRGMSTLVTSTAAAGREARGGGRACCHGAATDAASMEGMLAMRSSGCICNNTHANT